MTRDDFTAAFEEHKDAVYHFALRMTNSSSIADDIAQDVFVALLRAKHIDADCTSVKAWLLGVARHLIWKHWRRVGKLASLDERIHDVARPNPESIEAQAVAAAIANLRLLQREVLILATYEGMSLQEIAQTLKLDVGTVKARLYRARQTLKRQLAEYKPDCTCEAQHVNVDR